MATENHSTNLPQPQPLRICVCHIECFDDEDRRQARSRLLPWYKKKQRPNLFVFRTTRALTADALERELRNHVNWQEQEAMNYDWVVLLLSAHGFEPNLSGIFAGEDDAVRWHDVASLLRGRMAPQSVLLFYSCNGAYSGIAHLFRRGIRAPFCIFGPTIRCRPTAMIHACKDIIEALASGRVRTIHHAKRLVRDINAWGGRTFASKKPADDHSRFLRVIFQNGDWGVRRYPGRVGATPTGGQIIPLRGWTW